MTDPNTAATSAIDRNPFNSLTTPAGEHPTAADTTPVTARTVNTWPSPAPMPVPAPAPVAVSTAGSYDGFNVLAVSDMTTLGPDMVMLMGNLKLKLGDELVCFVRRATAG